MTGKFALILLYWHAFSAVLPDANIKALCLDNDNIKVLHMQSQDQKPKILDQVRSIMRLHHYSIHTERTYINLIKRYIAFHRMKSRKDLANGERRIEAFLTLNQRRGFT
ncbi:MAG: phage integrase N-terminal SAM-like domain-containing protein [Candidatus Schekmanbacteria bacterium]|nr:phage integrase N-terminal SAM-like domain-containing protein [Candidatus Schekmanbacteria bacterium]